MANLTDRQIRGIKPTQTHKYYPDGDGLYLRVTKTGTKTFYKRTQDGGKTRWLMLGHYPEISLLEARTRLTELTEVSTVATVESVYKLFDKAFLSKYKRPEVSRSRFNLDILPKLGSKPIASVTRLDISGVLAKIVERGSPVSANRTLADLKHLFQFAWERGYVAVDPTQGITRKSVGGKESPRSVVANVEDVLALRERLGKLHLTSMAAIYLCLLTGQRASEVLWLMANATPRTTWIELPDSKNGKPHKVYLSIQVRAALKLLDGLPPPKDHRVLSHALRRLGATFTPHDLRRTFATELSSLGVMPHVIEKCLNHSMEGVMAVYNHAEYLPERMAAWSLWGRHVAQKRRASKS